MSNLLILSVILFLLAVYISVKNPTLVPLSLVIAGITVFVDVVIESSGILDGGWGYPNSIYHLSVENIVIPIEMIFISFSCAIILVFIIRRYYKNLNSIIIIKHYQDIFLLLGIIFFVLYMLESVPLLVPIMVLGLFGFIISYRRRALVALFLFAWFADVLVETLLVNNLNEYFYADGYDPVLVGILYGFFAMFLGGLATARSGNTILKEVNK